MIVDWLKPSHVVTTSASQARSTSKVWTSSIRQTTFARHARDPHDGRSAGRAATRSVRARRSRVSAEAEVRSRRAGIDHRSLAPFRAEVPMAAVIRVRISIRFSAQRALIGIPADFQSDEGAPIGYEALARYATSSPLRNPRRSSICNAQGARRRSRGCLLENQSAIGSAAGGDGAALSEHSSGCVRVGRPIARRTTQRVAPGGRSAGSHRPRDHRAGFAR